MALDRSFANVVLLGVGFMLVFTAFQTMGNIEETVINSISLEDPTFKGDGYTSLAVIYAVFALANWTAPSLIALVGPKFAMVLGSLCYLLFIGCFLFPRTWLLYSTSSLLGFGAAFIWTAQGNYLTLNSNESNMSRNSGVFWALLQCSLLFGNLFVYFQFSGKDVIDQHTRLVVITVLLAVGGIGTIVLILLPKSRRIEYDILNESSHDGGNPATVCCCEQRGTRQAVGPVEAFRKSVRLFLTKDMALLSVTFFYIGVEFSFLSGVYSPSIGFTNSFGRESKQLVGLSGIFIGVGEILGGALFGLLGSKTVRHGRDPVILVGFLTHVAGFFLIFLNIPNAAPLGSTDDPAFMASNKFVAVFCSALVGFGDACFNTQVYSILGGMYPEDSAPAFALYKFVSSLGSATSFFYSSHAGLYVQLSVIAALGIAGTMSFWCVEWSSGRKPSSAAISNSASLSNDQEADEEE